MGNIYTQLGLEKRTMIHPQLERGIKLAAIAVGLNRFAIDAVSRTSSKRLGSPVRASWSSTFSGGRRLPCRYGPDGVQACRASRTAFGPPPCGTRAPAT